MTTGALMYVNQVLRYYSYNTLHKSEVQKSTWRISILLLLHQHHRNSKWWSIKTFLPNTWTWIILRYISTTKECQVIIPHSLRLLGGCGNGTMQRCVMTACCRPVTMGGEEGDGDDQCIHTSTIVCDSCWLRWWAWWDLRGWRLAGSCA